ncbi:MAG: FtsX-like permease family protein [Bacteroidota bacterium]
MKFPLYISKRYLFSKSSNNAINIMGFIAAAGIVISAAALFIVLSGFAGLKTYSLQFMSFVDPDLKLISSSGKSFNWTDADQARLTNIKEIAAFSKIVEERVVLTSENKNVLATFKGVDSNFRKVTRIDSMVRRGSWFTPKTNQIVTGWGISNQLSFGVLDFMQKITIYVPKPGRGQITSVKGAYNSLAVSNIGLVDINEEMNNEYIFGDIEMAQYLLDYKSDQITAIDIKVKDPSELDAVIDNLQEIFPGRFQIKTRAQLNDALYKMLNTENLAVYLIFTLVIIIALFNVIGAIIMMILDKKSSLNTLYNLGVEINQIKSIFFYQGSLLTLISGTIGLLIGLGMVWLQKQFNMVLLTPDLPYPVDITIGNVLLVMVTIYLLGILASKLASQRINKSLIST